MIYEFGKAFRFTLVVTDPTTGLPTTPTGTVVLTVTKPDGTTLTPSVTIASTGSYFGDATLAAAGDWRYNWHADSVLDEGVLQVAPSGAEVAWSPSLDAVAAHVPMRTVEETDPTGTLRKTFTGLTMPTARQVEQYIVEADSTVLSYTGTLDPTLGQHAASMSAMWAAAQVELAQPAEAFDSRRYEELIRAFTTGIAVLVERNTGLTDQTAGGQPLGVYSFPEPVAWGDVIL